MSLSEVVGGNLEAGVGALEADSWTVVRNDCGVSADSGLRSLDRRRCRRTRRAESAGPPGAPPWHHRGAGGPVRAEPRCYRRVARTRRLVGAESADAAERGLGADCPVTAAAEAQPLRQPQGLHASRPSGPSDPVHLTPS